MQELVSVRESRLFISILVPGIFTVSFQGQRTSDNECECCMYQGIWLVIQLWYEHGCEVDNPNDGDCGCDPVSQLRIDHLLALPTMHDRVAPVAHIPAAFPSGPRWWLAGGLSQKPENQLGRPTCRSLLLLILRFAYWAPLQVNLTVNPTVSPSWTRGARLSSGLAWMISSASRSSAKRSKPNRTCFSPLFMA